MVNLLKPEDHPPSSLPEKVEHIFILTGHLNFLLCKLPVHFPFLFIHGIDLFYPIGKWCSLCTQGGNPLLVKWA